MLGVATPDREPGRSSPRAVEALAAADVVACEDTRRTGRLLEHARRPGAAPAGGQRPHRAGARCGSCSRAARRGEAWRWSPTPERRASRTRASGWWRGGERRPRRRGRARPVGSRRRAGRKRPGDGPLLPRASLPPQGSGRTERLAALAVEPPHDGPVRGAPPAGPPSPTSPAPWAPPAGGPRPRGSQAPRREHCAAIARAVEWAEGGEPRRVRDRVRGGARTRACGDDAVVAALRAGLAAAPPSDGAAAAVAATLGVPKRRAYALSWWSCRRDRRRHRADGCRPDPWRGSPSATGRPQNRMVPAGLTSVRSPEQAAGREAANGRPRARGGRRRPTRRRRSREVYDARTLAALDTGVEPAWEGRRATVDRPPPASVARSPAAVLAGLMLGMREVFDPEATQGRLRARPDPGLQPVDGVTLHFVPGDPEATVRSSVDRRAPPDRRQAHSTSLDTPVDCRGSVAVRPSPPDPPRVAGGQAGMRVRSMVGGPRRRRARRRRAGGWRPGPMPRPRVPGAPAWRGGDLATSTDLAVEARRRRRPSAPPG